VKTEAGIISDSKGRGNGKLESQGRHAIHSQGGKGLCVSTSVIPGCWKIVSHCLTDDGMTCIGQYNGQASVSPGSSLPLPFPVTSAIVGIPSTRDGAFAVRVKGNCQEFVPDTTARLKGKLVWSGTLFATLKAKAEVAL